jgi:hypothetical protein
VTASTRPKIVTCSYRAYRREFGAAVRITLGVPRWIRLPDPRYTEHARWPYVAELAPRRDYFRAEDDEFDRRLLDQMHRLADDIDTNLSAITPEAGAICLLRFEREVTGPESCHRRLVAGFLPERYGMEIPEMDPAPSGCR